MPQTLTTELEAVNYMLRAIGERPVSNLDSIPSITKAIMARDTLRDTSREVQERGWSFNSEEQYPLSPDVSTNEISIPPNALRCDPTDQSLDCVNRGPKLYNRTTHSYSFDAVVSVNIVFYLTWDEIPESARKYIKIKAARVFQKQAIGAPDQASLTEEDEKLAFRDFLDSESCADAPNFLNNIPALNRRVNPVK
ncbi:hypothetical protein [Geobacter sp. SVR]|uniref:hypothetical protein n=1 Tax=Geobacter sp. SVR TaxID=2495594 RepID=UPI00143EF852|nr:hypothetical protein [Geobacter sp. SVR]BCS53308.1 hypothetical protein GSVR_16160 [Geobacter sp. SVR]GCF85566.1 hypothetical protein GSbR_21660 [Geobacter sp. SVR]